MELGKWFGTDGIRGTIHHGLMTSDMAVCVGRAVGVLCRERCSTTAPHVVLGRDTRLSGYMLEHALTSGLVSVGVYVLLVGELPTAAIALFARSVGATMGLMISASHNHYSDNGIKIFDASGMKLSQTDERIVERTIDSAIKHQLPLASARELGRVYHRDDARMHYVTHVTSLVTSTQPFRGIRAVIDCAYGVATSVAPCIFEQLGVTVLPIHTEADGCNINQKSGVVDPEQLRMEVLHHDADLGIAFDGDADRVVFCDEQGSIISTDQLLASVAVFLHTQNRLKGDGIVGTVMTNEGVDIYLKEHGLHLRRTDVGDRFVAHTMLQHGYNLGGEPSGHVIFRDYTTSSDGIIAAVHYLSFLQWSQKSMSTLGQEVDLFPSYSTNIHVATPFTAQEQVQTVVRNAYRRAGGDTGRIIVRPSGTESVVRVMVEAPDEERVVALKHALLPPLYEVLSHEKDISDRRK